MSCNTLLLDAVIRTFAKICCQKLGDPKFNISQNAGA